MNKRHKQSIMLANVFYDLGIPGKELRRRGECVVW